MYVLSVLAVVLCHCQLWPFGPCVQTAEERRAVSVAVKVSHGCSAGPKLCDY